MSAGIFLILVLVGAIMLFALMTSASPKRRRGRSGYNRGRSSSQPSVQSLSRDQIFTRWQTIQTMADSGGGNGLRQAVSEADKLLDHVMRQQGASGDTMRDRMQSFRNRFSDWPAVTLAHGIRNRLAHDVGYDLVPSQAKDALSDFRRALTDLGAL